MNFDLCKGCLAYDEDGPVYCSSVPEFNENKCPCVTCLIKGMCVETVLTCGLYADYDKFLRKEGVLK